MALSLGESVFSQSYVTLTGGAFLIGYALALGSGVVLASSGLVVTNRHLVEGGKAPVPEERTVRRRLLPGGRVKVEVVLEADDAWSAALEDGTRISAETLRRVACDCGLLAAGHEGRALNIGRRTRSIPPAIRRALMLRDRGCAFPGCPHTRFLHAHHLRHWLHGGATSLDNLLLLCSFHHHLVHEGGWRISAAADRGFLFQPPGGRDARIWPTRTTARCRAKSARWSRSGSRSRSKPPATKSGARSSSNGSGSGRTSTKHASSRSSS